MSEQPVSPECHLELMDLTKEEEFTELARQRRICGWDFDIPTINLWKSQPELKKLFWIMLPDPEAGSNPIRAGHISLGPSQGFLEPGLLQEDEIDLTLGSFFILPDYRARKLGRCVVQLLEDEAVKKPHGDPRCRYLTLSALSKRYVYESLARIAYAKTGMPKPPFSIQEWYEKLGYVTQREVPLYSEVNDYGDMMSLWEALMRKDLRGNI